MDPKVREVAQESQKPLLLWSTTPSLGSRVPGKSKKQRSLGSDFEVVVEARRSWIGKMDLVVDWVCEVHG